MPNETIKCDIAIIGAGPAGYSAAVYAVRAGFSVALWMGPEPGGQLTTTNEVENFIGFPEGILGPELMERSKKQAERLGVKLVSGSITKIVKIDSGFSLESDMQPGEVRAVIIATGAVAKWLGIPSETKLKGRGISGCATCDGFFFRGKKVAVIGAGDVAMEDAQSLSNFAESVTVLVRKPESGVRASKAMFERAKNNPKISFMFSTEVNEFLGDQKLSGIRAKNNVTNELTELTVDGAFIAVGHRPNTEAFRDLIECDEEGYIKAQGTKTNVPGVFAAGDVADRVYRQAITSAGTGCMAALDAKKYLEELGDER